MKCNEAKNLIGASLDGSLDADSLTSLGDHVDGCVECADEMVLMGQIISAACQIDSVDPPASLKDRILNATVWDCTQMSDMLSEYIDHMVSPEESCLVSNHLSSCPECRNLFAAMQDITDKMAAIEMLDIPSGLHQSIAAATYQRVGTFDLLTHNITRLLSIGTVRWASASVALLVLAAVLTTSMKTTSPVIQIAKVATPAPQVHKMINEPNDVASIPATVVKPAKPTTITATPKPSQRALPTPAKLNTQPIRNKSHKAVTHRVFTAAVGTKPVNEIKIIVAQAPPQQEVATSPVPVAPVATASVDLKAQIRDQARQQERKVWGQATDDRWAREAQQLAISSKKSDQQGRVKLVSVSF